MENQTILDDSLANTDNSKLPNASAGLRFANYVIDLIILYILYFLFMVFVMATNSLSKSILDSILFNFSGIVILFLYYLIFETATNGRTLGKYITKTRVIKENGERPTGYDYAIRSVSRLIPFEAFSAFSKNAHMWHDSLAKTRVVKING